MNKPFAILAGPAGVQFCCIESDASNFNPDVFDERALQSRKLLDGLAQAGRGNTFFFDWAGRSLVLRHYRRGGLVRHISTDKYIFMGIERTRALREFEVLCRLELLNLPASRPFACRIQRHGFVYSASLVTYRLPGMTLAERLNLSVIDDAVWKLAGSAVARFHRAGLCHADLNAHNVIIDENDTVSLIDFDRARFRSLPREPATDGWALGNVQRLKRSLLKITQKTSPQGNASNTASVLHGFRILHRQWVETLRG